MKEKIFGDLLATFYIWNESGGAKYENRKGGRSTLTERELEEKERTEQNKQRRGKETNKRRR